MPDPLLGIGVDGGMMQGQPSESWMSRQLTNFSWVEPNAVAGMGFPTVQGLSELAAANVQAVLTLTEQPIPDVADVEQHHEPFIDFGTPSMEQLDRCVVWMGEQRAAGRAVVVHCMAGIGRTGTVLAAWLIAQGQSPEAAIATVRRARPGSIETRGQMASLFEFAAFRAAAAESDS